MLLLLRYIHGRWDPSMEYLKGWNTFKSLPQGTSTAPTCLRTSLEGLQGWNTLISLPQGTSTAPTCLRTSFEVLQAWNVDPQTLKTRRGRSEISWNR